MKYIIISIGFNVNEISFPKHISNSATSLKKEFHRDFNLEDILIEFIVSLNKYIIHNL